MMKKKKKTRIESTVVELLFEASKLGEINLEHNSQRYAEQWSNPSWGSDLIISFVNNDYIPAIIICVIDDEMYVIDGKQRITYLKKFMGNKMKISNSVLDPIVEYKDDDGNIIEYDMRGKFYKDLPDKLQYRIKKCPMTQVIKENCTDEDVIKDLIKYNHAKPMNPSQIAIVYSNANSEFVKRVSANHFFSDCGDYNVDTLTKNGTIDRTVMETVLATYNPDAWQRDTSKLGKYIGECKEEVFNEVNGLLDRLYPICEGFKYGELFNKKDTFLWVATFNKFTKLGIEDNEFAKFMDKFIEELHKKEVEIDGEKTSFDVISGKNGTKNKTKVLKKLVILEKLLNEFFGITDDGSKKETTEDRDNKVEEDIVVESEIDLAESVSSLLNMKKEEIKGELDYYVDLANEYMDTCVKDGSCLKDKNNYTAMVALVIYSEKKEIELDKWLEDYAKRVESIDKNNLNSLMDMINDLQKFVNTAA